MRVLLLSKDERNAFLLQRLKQEGNEVALLTRAATSNGSWDGILPRAANLEDAVKWQPDIVLVDSPGFGPIVKRLRERGIVVIGGGNFHDRIEQNYGFGMALLETASVPTSEWAEFTDVATASEYVHGKEYPWKLVNPDRSTNSFRNDVDLQLYLEELEAGGNTPPSFSLMRDWPGPEQGEPMRFCCPFYLVGMIGSKGLMNPCMALQISHNLLEDGQGIPTQEGVSLIPISSAHPLVELTLKRLSNALVNLQYLGPVFLGCVSEPPQDNNDWVGRVCVDNIGLTPPDGFWAAFTRGLEMTLEFFLDRMVNPRRADTPYEFWNGVISSRKVSVPPYPLTEARWIAEEDRQALVSKMPPLSLPVNHQGILWNSIRKAGETVELVHPVLGYVTGRGGSYFDSLSQIRIESSGLRIPYAQVKLTPDRTFEVDMLPVETAKIQLRYEEVEGMLEVVNG